MNKIVGIGACVFDTLYNIPSYPKEDTKMRATASKPAGGGPVATGLVAAQKLGEQTSYIGVLSDDNGGVFLKKDFEKYGVGTDLIEVKSGYRSFASVLWLSADTTARTCVFDKGDEDDGCLRTTEDRGHLLVEVGNAILHIDEEEHYIGLLYGNEHLLASSSFFIVFLVELIGKGGRSDCALLFFMLCAR